MSAPQVVVGDIVEVSVYCKLVEQVAINVLHYNVDAVGGVAVKYDELAGRIYAKLEDAYRDWMTDAAQFAGVGVRRLYPLPKSIQYTRIDPVDGTLSAFTLPAQIAGLITVRTPKPGPGGRGRVYIPFGSVNWSDVEGNMTPDAETQLAVIADLLGPTAAWQEATAAWTVVATLQVSAAVGAPECDNILPTGKWATQRRRGNYGKANSLPI